MTIYFSRMLMVVNQVYFYCLLQASICTWTQPTPSPHRPYWQTATMCACLPTNSTPSTCGRMTQQTHWGTSCGQQTWWSCTTVWKGERWMDSMTKFCSRFSSSSHWSHLIAALTYGHMLQTMRRPSTKADSSTTLVKNPLCGHLLADGSIPVMLSISRQYLDVQCTLKPFR